MKNWKRLSLFCVLLAVALCAIPLTNSSARGRLSALVGLRMVSGTSLNGYTTGNRRFDSYLVASGRRHRVDPLLMYALINHESGFRAHAHSYKGARGLAQLMPATARGLGVKNIHDPQQNIEGGTKYIRRLLNRFKGNLALALAGYNAGEGAVSKYGNSVPPYRETQNYVLNIGYRYSRLRPGALRRR